VVGGFVVSIVVPFAVVVPVGVPFRTPRMAAGGVGGVAPGLSEPVGCPVDPLSCPASAAALLPWVDAQRAAHCSAREGGFDPYAFGRSGIAFPIGRPPLAATVAASAAFAAFSAAALAASSAACFLDPVSSSGECSGALKAPPGSPASDGGAVELRALELELVDFPVPDPDGCDIYLISLRGNMNRTHKILCTGFTTLISFLFHV